MKKRALFFINSHSGKGQIREHLVDILELFDRAGYEPTLAFTSADHQEMVGLEKAEERYDLIVCAGGDGTLSTTVNAMMERGLSLPLGYIPAGTTNDFASSLRLSKDPLEAAHIILEGRTFRCDVGRFNQRYFSYVAAFGAFTQVVYQTSQQFKSLLGRAAYILEGIKSIANIKTFHVRVEHDGGVIDDQLILGMVTNSTSVGGFKTSSKLEVAMNDGMAEVLLVRMPQNPMELQTAINSLLKQEIDLNFVYSFKTRRLRLQSDVMLPWTLDGEYGGTMDQVEIGVQQEALTIVVPQEGRVVTY